MSMTVEAGRPEPKVCYIYLSLPGLLAGAVLGAFLMCSYQTVLLYSPQFSTIFTLPAESVKLIETGRWIESMHYWPLAILPITGLFLGPLANRRRFDGEKFSFTRFLVRFIVWLTCLVFVAMVTAGLILPIVKLVYPEWFPAAS